MASVRLPHAWRSERGAELVEFALVLPLLLFVIMGLVDFGFLFQRFQVVNNAAREGARIAVLPGGYGQADVEARVRNYMTAGGVANSGTNTTVSLTNTTIVTGVGPALRCRRVQVTYASRYLFLGPIAGWFGGTFTSATLTGVAVMRYEIAP